MRSLLLLPLLVSPVCADIIIDDFDDPARTVSPAMDNVLVQTEHVGPLDALRGIRLASSGTNPDATLDIADSLFRVEVGDLHRTDELTPLFATQLFYEFAPTDFTSGNAFLVDFKSVQGSVLPEMIRIRIYDDDPSFSYIGFFRPVPAGSYTAAIPFADFVRRDGVPHDINFAKIWRVWPEFYANRRLNDYTNHHWTIQVERIRVGIVPEPEGLGFFFITMTWRQRRCGPFSCSYPSASGDVRLPPSSRTSRN